MFYIDSRFTTKQINKALREQREITFRRGTYKLTECLILHSDTTITCEDGVTFERHNKGRMLQTLADENTTKYNGVHNVWWCGGFFKADTNETPANVITLFHAISIALEKVNVLGCRGYHSIEINACKGIAIRECFIGGQSSKPGEDFREAIQIDFANYDGLKIKGAKNTAKCYDNTHCCNISVIDTKIADCPNGFGTHSVSFKEDYHKKIELKNMRFYNIKGKEIQLFGVDGFELDEVRSETSDCICPPRIRIGTKTKGHLVTGGKKEIEPRRNKNIRIESTVID